MENQPRRAFSDPRLTRIEEKIRTLQRLNLDDGLACLATADLSGLGALAFGRRQAAFGLQAFYIVNHHLNYTNVCENGCRFCAFHRSPGAPGGYVLSPEEAAARIAESPMEGLKEVHIVGGCDPDIPFDYYPRLLKAVKAARPGIRLKAFTAVEIWHMAQSSGLTPREVLSRLKEAGLDAMPGGGAEVFSERVRKQLFPKKIDAPTWLKIHATAHALGIPTNATLLFGHLETPRERVAHLLALRDQQDRSKGFNAFIPLPFHPANTGLSSLPGPTGVEILKTLAAARLLLDNIPHLKAYWVMLGLNLAQAALHFGADDLEGTLVCEHIAHQAGARTEQGLTRSRLEDLIRDAGFIPVERDTFHRVEGGPHC